MPWYSTQTALLPVVASQAQQMGELALGSWRERVGERAYQASGKGAGWVRVAASDTRQKGHERYDDGLGNPMVNPRFEGRQELVQAGFDVHQAYDGDVLRTAAGLYVGKGRADADVWQRDTASGQELGAGHIRSDERHMGVYWTGMNARQVYVDAVLHYSSADHRLRGSGVHSTLKGHGMAASLEVGRQIATSAEWTITPQAQVRWQQIAMDDLEVDMQGATIARYRFGDTSSLLGRIGVAARYQRQPAWSLWARVDLLHQFEGRNTVDYQAVQGGVSPRFTSGTQGSSHALLLGGDVRIGRAVDLFGSAGHQGSLSGERGEGWQARLGLRVHW